MNKKLRCINKQQNVRGNLQFAEIDEKGNPKNEILVTIAFKDPAAAAQFEHGKDYTVSFEIAAE